jgi:hypothetical protein
MAKQKMVEVEFLQAEGRTHTTAQMREDVAQIYEAKKKVKIKRSASGRQTQGTEVKGDAKDS